MKRCDSPSVLMSVQTEQDVSFKGDTKQDVSFKGDTKQDVSIKD